MRWQLICSHPIKIPRNARPPGGSAVFLRSLSTAPDPRSKKDEDWTLASRHACRYYVSQPPFRLTLKVLGEAMLPSQVAGTMSILLLLCPYFSVAAAHAQRLFAALPRG